MRGFSCHLQTPSNLTSTAAPSACWESLSHPHLFTVSLISCHSTCQRDRGSSKHLTRRWRNNITESLTPELLSTIITKKKHVCYSYTSFKLKIKSIYCVYFFRIRLEVHLTYTGRND